MVMRLTDGLRNNGRIIVCDNFFTSINLATTLFDAHTYLLGTIRANRQGNSQEFIRETLEPGQHKYIFKNYMTMVKLQVRRET